MLKQPFDIRSVPSALPIHHHHPNHIAHNKSVEKHLIVVTTIYLSFHYVVVVCYLFSFCFLFNRSYCLSLCCHLYAASFLSHATLRSNENLRQQQLRFIFVFDLWFMETMFMFLIHSKATQFWLCNQIVLFFFYFATIFSCGFKENTFTDKLLMPK